MLLILFLRSVPLGQDVVLKLCDKYQNSNRVVTADNFFTSITLAELLWEKGLRYVGTMRKNKCEIPEEFLPNRRRPEFSSQFAFKQHLTLTSYVPKKYKDVVLLSKNHHDETISNKPSKKPEIILYYNITKGGVDRLDQLVESFTCRRKTNRWTSSVLMNMLNIAAYNAFVLGNGKF